ncbi:MAG: hypothetical protein ACREX3_13730 [Gammaproteobacteria bacterium]
MPTNRPTGWVYLTSDCTIRWQRGDRAAYVFQGRKVGSWSIEGLLGKIPVSPAGWADLAEIKLIGEKWVHTKSVRTG